MWLITGHGTKPSQFSLFGVECITFAQKARISSLGGAGEDKKTVTIIREEVYLAMRPDPGRIRGQLVKAKL